ncbi:AbrB/MazE/SpoVT family DNA-binding domain-containing protein [Photorhabdus khanii]|uniref:AbrB/MazE/SpoVT family DNA-binding domain-containing protein n=1 Tax=Photorhabdus khanii subsp. guanajuatensis TaxID=2100166 RepID=A0A4R4IW49_9GAMM|nr:AbrB/MazE/SpoVT family DNA-binding domain-containing protein [Photorhabdus khanii]TDB45123.1 AbrB/MazE/SpoVT family DNA-binding domain-containing protein [Photorhabdus khanii subsp. guanajuatensis]
MRESFVKQTTVFKSNCPQVVRSFKAVALSEEVRRIDVAGETWDSWFDGSGVTADFMAEHGQLPVQEREGFNLIFVRCIYCLF